MDMLLSELAVKTHVLEQFIKKELVEHAHNVRKVSILLVGCTRNQELNSGRARAESSENIMNLTPICTAYHVAM
jgi:hypothetical protein